MTDRADVLNPRRSRVRWWMCALLFFAITINYVDRQVISVLKPTLEKAFNWDQVDYSNIVFAFQCAYAVGLFSAGWLIDRIGVKLGLALAVFIWSVAAVCHGLASVVPVAQATAFFIVVRAMLGIGEAGAFPSAIRATAEWFPRKERSLATGIFNAGSNVGAIFTPLVAPVLVHRYGWPAAFYLTGALGLVWLTAWLLFYRRPEDHAGVSPAELAHIRSDAVEASTPIPWLTLLAHREMWAFAIGKFLTDPIWSLYLFWVPDFLNKRHGLTIADFGAPLVAIYLMADVGSIGGGWLSSRLIARGWSVNAGRKLALLICAVAVVPIVFAPIVSTTWAATLLIGLAAAAHQGWSCNLFTVASDSFPKRAVASVTGLGGTAGAVGGMILAKAVGYILKATHDSYIIPFAIGGSAYLIALAIIHLLIPRIGDARDRTLPLVAERV